MAHKLPVGIQSFAKLREDGFLYVDKTSYVYRLVTEGRPYFLSRPRRFGKSLLLSTMRAYWEGRRELFAGLDIERLSDGDADAFQSHPVFYFDLNGQDYESDALERVLDAMLCDWEPLYGCTSGDWTLGTRFERLLEAAHAQTGRRCVVLVDEYDKPLLETLENSDLNEHNRSVFKGFFSVLKKADEHLRFVFITGVTKFSKVSIFSDLNQLRDISLTREYAGICGVTEKELADNFSDDIAKLAAEQGLSQDECLQELRDTYDGYRFHQDAEGVYNPFSLLNAFADRDFGSYWFASGTPTFLVHRMHRRGFDVHRLTDGSIFATDAQLSDYRADNPNLTPLLYQTGYLTIASFDRRRRRYTLEVPNGEVRYGLFECLAQEYAPASMGSMGADIFTFDEHVETGNLEGMRDVLTAIFASIPYTQQDRPFEHYFQTVIWLVFQLLGRYVHCEVHTAYGRIDCVAETPDYVYLFELKRDGTAEEALRQIEEKGYALRYAADQRTLYRIGVAFDSQTRQLSDWRVG